jgi:hypothetical protein
LAGAVAKKMKVCFVGWHRNSNYFFVRWRFFIGLFLSVACSFKAVSCQFVGFKNVHSKL